MLICYDIANPKRLAKVHRMVSKEAMMLQYSVYITMMTRIEAKEMLQALEKIIDLNEDDIRIYAIPSNPDIVCLGIAPYMTGFFSDVMIY